MKKRTSSMSRRVVSLLMSLVLTLTLVTPAAFATEVVGGSGTAIIEGNANPADANPSGDNEGKDDENKDTEHGGDEQPTNPGDEDKNPGEGDGGSDDANKPGEDNKGKQNTEDENNSEDDIAPLNDDTDSDVWDGKPAEKFAGGAGTVDDPYKISTGAELAYLAGKVNGGESYSGEYFKLTNDIRLNEQDVPTGGNSWTPIGNSSNKFQGTFDGDGHTISGLYITATGSGAGNLGLFGNLGNSAVIKNLIVKGTVDCDKKTYVAGIAGRCVAWKTVVQNCGFYGNVVGGNSNVGGVVGFGNNVAKNCWYYYSGDTDGYKVGVSGGTAGNNCYQNVSSSAKGTYVQANFADTVTEKLNASLSDGDKLWKVGTKHPEFPGPNERVVILDKYLPTSTAAMSIKDDVSGKLVSQIIVENGGQVTLVPTGTVWYSLDGKNWDSFSGERSIQINATEQTVRIYYAASDEEMEAGAWYKKDEGTSETPYEIGSAAQLAYLAKLVNEGTNFKDKFIRLTGDIDLATVCGEQAGNWTPIGDASHAFVGTFDGNGCSVKNLYINNAAQYQGLFGNVGSGGMVKNLIVTGTVTAANQARVGGIVAYGAYNSVVQNCGFFGAVTAGTSLTGGVAGYGMIKNCWYYQPKEQVTNVGVCGGTPTNCYQNVSVNSNGTYVADNFAATVANKLNVEAFKDVTLLLWKAVADGYPVFDAAADRDNMVPVTLETYVKASSVVGKIEISVQGSEPLTAYLAKKGDSITLKLVENYPDDGDKIYYTPDKDKHSSDEIVEITAAGVPYTVPMKLAEGQTSVTLYYGTMEEFNAVEGVSAWYYNGTNKITNEAELRFLATLVNDKHIDFSGKVINLDNDIALTETWMPIGTVDHPFHGIFNGNGHTISGLKVEGAYANAGLFGVVEEGTVKQVNLRDGKISSTTEGANVGGIAGCIRSESPIKTAAVESCDSNVEVIAAGKNANAGGIAGTIVGKGSLKYSICTGKVTATGENAVAGGLVGRITDTEKYSGTVQGGYFYNETQKDFPAIAVKGDKSTITYCFFLADKSTYDKKDTQKGVTSGGAADIGDTGARTKDEFLAGRVLWELGKAGPGNVFGVNKTPAADDFMLPKLFVTGMTGARAVYQLSLTKTGGEDNEVVKLINGNGAPTLTDGNTQYVYGAGSTAITLDSSSISDGRMAVYAPNEPKQISSYESYNKYTYTVGKTYTADTSWYDPAKTVYELWDDDDLFGLAKLVNDGTTDFTGKTINLMTSITLNGYDWIPIGGKDNYAFGGAFDGQHFTISDMSVNEPIRGASFGSAGLFGALKNGEVKNLTVTGAIKLENNSALCVGGIVAECSQGTVTTCVSRVNITVQACTNVVSVGGIVGKGDKSSKIANCLREGSITVETTQTNNTFVGGIVSSGPQVDSCWNTGMITVNVPNTDQVYVGGIAAQVLKTQPVTNCFNSGIVSVQGNPDKAEFYVGGISGKIGKAGVYNSYNMGDVTGAEGKTYGIGSANITNCYYICTVGTEKKSDYIQKGDEATATTITVTPGEDGKNTYKIGTGENAQELVAVLNTNRGTYTQWINKKAAPCNPVHIVRWDGCAEEGVEGIVTLTYMPNEGRGSAYSTSLELKDGKATTDVADPSTIGIRGRNSSFVGWTEDVNGNGGTRYKSPDTITISEDTTLYAQWNPFWKGEGTQNSPYELTSKEEFMLMNDKDAVIDSSTYFMIMNDIDLGSYTSFSFHGNLSGKKNAANENPVLTISNSAGLFTSITGGGDAPDGSDGVIIKDLTIAGTVYSERGYVGGLAGGIGAGSVVTLQNITNRATVTATSTNRSAGGLIGRLYGGNMPLVVIKCRNEAAVTSAEEAGGLVGSSEGNLRGMKFTNCSNIGTVTSTAGFAAGIVAGNDSGYYDLENCYNGGTITAHGGKASGLANASLNAVNCTNSGNVTSTSGTASGIIGTGSATRCINTNEAEIKGSYGAAGIVYDAHYRDVEFCANFGKVTATAGSGAAKRAYGIASQGTIKNCFTYNNETHVPVAGATGRNCTVTNSYYLANSDTEFPSTMGGTPATLDDFTSGKVAWGVDGGTGAHVGWWTQDTTKGYPKLLPAADKAQSYYRAQATCGTGGAVTLDSSLGYTSTKDADNAVYGPAGTSVTIKATPKDNTFGLKSLTWTHNGQTDALPTKGIPNIVIPAESNVTIHAEFASVGTGGNGGYYYGGSGDGTGAGDESDEGLQDGVNMDVEYDIKGLVLGAYAEWGSNGGNKSFQKWLEENPNVVRALLTNSLDNMATAAVGKKTDEAKDLAALLLASLNEHTGVDGKDGDTITKALQKYIDSGSDEVFSAWLTGGGGMASGTYESIYGQYASSLAALADRLYSKWEASGTSMTFPVWLDSQQVSMDSLSENADEPDTDNTNDPQTSDAPDDVPDGQDTEGGASGNSVWEVIGTVVRENPILVWSIVAVIAALIIVGAVRRYHKVKRDEHDEK